MKHGTGVVAAVALGALLLFGLGKWDGMVSAGDRQTIREAKAVVRAGAAYRARLAALRDSAAAHEARIATLEGLAGRQQARYDSLVSAEAQGATEAQTGPVASLAANLGLQVHPDGWLADSGTVRHLARLAWRSAVRLPATEALLITTDSLWHANQQLVETWHVAAALAQARVTTLETSLAATLKVADCRVLFWSCPSRTTTFLLGLAGGAVVGYAVAK